MNTWFHLNPDLLFWAIIVLSVALLVLESMALQYLGANHPRAWESLGRRRSLNRSFPEHFTFATFFWLRRHRRLSDPVLNGLGMLLNAVAVGVLVCGVYLFAVMG
jgi:hypothetical protein